MSVLFTMPQGRPPGLSDPTQIPPPPIARPGVAITPVALRFLWHRRPSLLHPSQSNDRPNKGVIAEEASPEAYRAIGGVARNIIANRAIVGH